MTIRTVPGFAPARGSRRWFAGLRQDSGAALCLPRKPYYLARGQTTHARGQTIRLLCQEWAYRRALGLTGTDVQTAHN